MKIYAEFVGLPEMHLGKELFEALCAIVPEGRVINKGPMGFVSQSFRVKVRLDDVRYTKVIKVLEEHGWTPRVDGWRPRGPKQYWLRYLRQYSRRDIAEAELLLLHPRAYCEGLYRTEDGLIKLDADKLRRRAHIAHATPEWIVVSDRARRLIEEAGMRHVVFRPTVAVSYRHVKEKVIQWERLGGPWWELSSSYVLPRLSPTVELRDRFGNPHDGDDAKGYYIHEGLFLRPELHYRRADIPATLAFDVACTHECFGMPTPDDRLKVCSPRFAAFCLSHKLTTGWVPVRIDPD